jgi:hypothetical protein
MARWIGAAMAMAVMTACATTPDPDPVAQGAKLMSQMKEASGGAKLDEVSTYHSSGTHVRDGRINGVFESWGDYRTMAFTVIETFDGVTTSGGFDGKVGWNIGPDGIVRVGATPQAMNNAKLNAYLNTQAYFWPERFPAKFEYQGKQEADGKKYDVVAVTPEGGQAINLWLDPKTHRLARLTGTNGRATFTGVIHTELNVDGVWMMDTGLQTMVAGNETHTESHNLESFVFGPIPLERLQVPR